MDKILFFKKYMALLTTTFPFSTAQRRPVGRYEPEADTKHDLDLLLNLTIILSCFHR